MVPRADANAAEGHVGDELYNVRRTQKFQVDGCRSQDYAYIICQKSSGQKQAFEGLEVDV